MRLIERPADIIAKTAPSDAIVKNAWYLGAWSDEVSQELFARRIADEPMVFYRTGDGTAAALLDRCPHRRFRFRPANSRATSCSAATTASASTRAARA